MPRHAFRISTALLFSMIVVLATALGSNAQNLPGPALPAPALAGRSFMTGVYPVYQIATSSALPNAMALTIGRALAYSANGGVTWETIRQGPWTSIPWPAIVPRGDPAAPVRVVVAADYLKIDRTGDYGKTWARTSLPLPPNVTPGACCGEGARLVVSAVDPNRLYAEYVLKPPIVPPPFQFSSRSDDKYAIYTSGDAGLNWQLILYGDGAPHISPSPILANRVHVGLKRSDDAGKTWSGMPVSTRDVLALDAYNPNLLYRLYLDYSGKYVEFEGDSGQGLRSTDGGTTWSPWAQQPCPRYYQLLAHPTNSNVLFLRCKYSTTWDGQGGRGILLRSQNGGDSRQALSDAKGDLLAPDFSQPGRLLWARGDGLWASTDAGTHWTNLTPDYIGPVPVGWRSRTKPSSFAAECDTCDLLSVEALSQDNAWAVGEEGMIVHWNGSAWAKVSSPVTTTLNAISMVSANDGWAVGAGGEILHWNGSVWSQVTSPVLGTGTLNSVDMVSATDGWAVGGGILLRWNSSTWTQVSSPVDASFESVFMLSANDGWAVGRTGIPITSVMLHWNGTQWSETDPGLCDSPIALAGVATDEIWAVAFGGLCRWNGSAWSVLSVPSPLEFPLSIAMLSSSDGWVVGASGRVLHWDSSTWTDLPQRPTNRGLLGIAMLDAKHGWIVGENGIILDRVASAYLPSLMK